MRITRRIFALPVAAATLLISAGGASAAPVEVITEDVSFGFLPNSCNGEGVIFLEGFFHTVVKTNPDGSIKQEAMIHTTGTGTSGTRYISNEPLNDTFSAITDDELDFMGVLVSLGAQPNEITVVHLHTDPSLDTVEIVCRG